MRMVQSRLRKFMTLGCHLEDLDHYNVSLMNGTDTDDYTDDNAINAYLIFVIFLTRARF